MSDLNPYLPPEAPPLPPGGYYTGTAAGALDDKTLKKHYNNSRSISALTFLFGLGALGCIVLVVSGSRMVQNENGSLGPLYGIFAGAAVLNLVTMIGLIRRAPWGRVLGIICCVPTLINFPIGTAIGVLGIVALAGSPQLFGPDRLNPKELAAEIKARKRR